MLSFGVVSALGPWLKVHAQEIKDGGSQPPEILEAISRQLRIADGVLDVLEPEVSLQCTSIVADNDAVEHTPVIHRARRAAYSATFD